MWFLTLVPFSSILTSLISVVRLSTPYSHQLYGNNSQNTILSKYSEAERNGLILFRKMVDDVLEKDYERTDQFLIKWIRARNMDLNAADEMFRKAQQWRKEYSMDTILNETPLNFPGKGNGFVWNLDGVANDGTPVAMLKTMRLDIRALLMGGLKSNITRQAFQFFELLVTRIWHLNGMSGREVSQGTIVVDGSIYNLRQHGCFECISVYIDILRVAQLIYPQYSKLAVLVNAPHIVRPLIDIVKPILSSSALKSIHVFGSDKKEWSTFLLKHISADQLSSYFGGTAPW